MSTLLARMGAGFADPVHGAQQTFRALLGAMAEPGRVLALPDAAIAGLAPADADLRPPLDTALAATLLTLLDADTPVHLAGTLDTEDTRAWLRFHTGTRALPRATAMTAARARDVDDALWTALDLGTEDAPESSATLFVEVDGLSDQPMERAIALKLRGAGIETSRDLAVAGLPAAFWTWRTALRAQLPRGIDIVLVCGRRLAAIPRSTHLRSES
jgi:alpha-D-ribose 1-methylphosphonate 5-triphosphate synthase subunit PhnH